MGEMRRFKLWLLLMLSCAWACDLGAAQRVPCLSDDDCASQGSQARCLALVEGDTLDDFCSAGPFCPESAVAPNFLSAPRICDLDEDDDGLADVYQRDGYEPRFFGAGEVAGAEAPLSGGHLEITGLFARGCEVCEEGQSRPDACCCGTTCAQAPCSQGLVVAQRAATVGERTDRLFEGRCVPGGAVEPLELGEPCLYDVNCASGRCADFCVDGRAGSPCDGNSDCLTGNCNGVCRCLDASDCDEGQVCASGECLPTMLGEGAACVVEEQCVSGTCIEGVCSSGGSGAICEVDSDCVDGACVRVDSQRVCSAGRSFDPCNNRDDCLGSASCVGERCTSGQLGEPCERGTRDGDCEGDLVCTAQGLCSTGTDGSECVTDEDCLALVQCLAGACEPRSVEAAEGVCEAAGLLGVLRHDEAVDLDFTPIQPLPGGGSCGEGAEQNSLQRALRFTLSGDALVRRSYIAPDARRLFIRESCDVPSSAFECQAGGSLSSFGGSFGLAAGDYTFHISDTDNAPAATVSLRAVYDFPSEGGGEDLGARLELGSCQAPTPVTLGSFHGSVRNGPRDHEGCSNSLGPESVLSFTPESSGAVCVRGVENNFDVVLYVRQGGCAEGVQVVCEAGIVGDAEVEFDAFAGTEYYIFVDTFGDDDGGGFGLILSEGACP